MTEDDLRALIRETVLKALAAKGVPAAADPPRAQEGVAHEPAEPSHPSHDVYLTLVNVGEACVIEPAVTCHHCNYCRSHGH